MPQPTRAELIAGLRGDHAALKLIAEMIASAVSGQNPDGSTLRFLVDIGAETVTVENLEVAVLGAIADEAVAAGATGSISAKLRRLSADLATLMAAAATSAKQDEQVTALALLTPAARAFTIAPNDGADLANNTRGLMVAVAGDVKVDFVTTGTAIVLTGLLVGVVYPVQVKKVYATGTTATGLTAFY